MSEVRFHFVERDNPLYQAAVELRYEVFFRPTETPIDQLHDQHEVASLHGVATDHSGSLLGYVRLTAHPEGVGRVSQLVTAPRARGQMPILIGLFKLVIGAAQQAGLIRLPNIPVCRRAGFVKVGEPFPSVKTQIPHQRMELDLARRATSLARRVS